MAETWFVIVYDYEFGKRTTVSPEIYSDRTEALSHLRYQPPYLESFLKEFSSREDAEDFQKLHQLELPVKW